MGRSSIFCAALLAVFVIENPQCGGHRGDHPQLAVAYLEQGRFDRALVEVRRALRQGGQDPSLHLIAALAHLGLEEPDAALRALQEALRLTPEDERLHATLRDICVQEERYDLGRDILRPLQEEFPESARISAGLGWAHMHLDEVEAAEKHLLQAAGLDSTYLFGRVQLGRLYMRQERFADAEQVLGPALGISPDNAQILLALGESRLRQGRPEEAERNFARALEHSDAPADLATRIAQVYYGLGLRRQTIDYYERALRAGREDPFVLNNLAWACAEEGIYLDRALELSLRAVKSDVDNVVYLDTYAEILHRKGRHAQAIAIMRRALELEPPGGDNRTYLEEQMEKFLQAQAVRKGS